MARAKLERRSALGVLLALAAMALLGGFVFGVSYYPASIGGLGPIFLARAATALFLIAHASATEGLHRRLFPRDLLPAVVLLAALDTGGYVFFNVGVRHDAT